MGSRNRVTVTIAGDGRTFGARGWRVVELMRGAGLRPIFVGGSGWTADYGRLADLIAYLEHRHIPVLIEDARQGELFEAGGAS